MAAATSSSILVRSSDVGTSLLLSKNSGSEGCPVGPLQHQSSSLSALAQRCLRSIASSTPQVSATEQTQWPKTKAAVGNGRGGLPMAPAGVPTAVWAHN